MIKYCSVIPECYVFVPVIWYIIIPYQLGLYYLEPQCSPCHLGCCPSVHEDRQVLEDSHNFYDDSAVVLWYFLFIVLLCCYCHMLYLVSWALCILSLNIVLIIQRVGATCTTGILPRPSNPIGGYFLYPVMRKDCFIVLDESFIILSTELQTIINCPLWFGYLTLHKSYSSCAYVKEKHEVCNFQPFALVRILCNNYYDVFLRAPHGIG